MKAWENSLISLKLKTYCEMLEDCTSNTVCTYAVHTFKVCKVYVRHIRGIRNYNHIVRLLRLIQEKELC